MIGKARGPGGRRREYRFLKNIDGMQTSKMMSKHKIYSRSSDMASV